MSLPSLRQLEYLVALADVSHFRKAAERVHVSQPTLSGQITELEQRLGVSLVERTRHFVHLTPVGKAVADRARGVLREVETFRLLFVFVVLQHERRRIVHFGLSIWIM